MRHAFKEWAVICRSLAAGRQSLILRKGGIAEKGGAFRPDIPQFLLFPTRFHESLEQVVPEAIPLLREAERDAPPEGRIVLRHVATVTDVARVVSAAALRLLRPFHVWSDAVVLERFGRGRVPELSAMIVRVSELPEAVELPMKKDYGGCTSWVELAEEIDVADSRPVMGDPEFERKRGEILEALKRPRQEI